MLEISTGHQKRCEFAAEASESLDKRPGVSPGANTEAAALMEAHSERERAMAMYARHGDGQPVSSPARFCVGEWKLSGPALSSTWRA